MTINHLIRQPIRLINFKWSPLSKRVAILFGLILGFIVSLIVPFFNQCLTFTSSSILSSTSSVNYDSSSKSSNWFEEIINSDYNPIVKLPLTNGSSQSNEQQFKSYNSKRPHFVLEELDVNEKLLIVVLTSDQTFGNLGYLLNETLSKHGDRILFFKESNSQQQQLTQSSSSLINLPPSDEPLLTRILNHLDSSFDPGKVKSKLRAYNFIFFINDNSYVKGDYLRQLVDQLSINQHIFAPAHQIDTENVHHHLYDHNHNYNQNHNNNQRVKSDPCSSELSFSPKIDQNQLYHFQSGLLISSSLIVSCGNDLKCLYRSCNQSLINSYRLLPDNSDQLFLDPISFRKSLIIYPLFTTKVYANVHHFHLQSSLNNNLRQLHQLNVKINSFVDKHGNLNGENGKIKNNHWSSSSSSNWPFAIVTCHDPIDRFDVIHWNYQENGIIYMADDFHVLRVENEAEKVDRQSIESLAIRWLNTKYPNFGSMGKEIKITNVYRRFDANRGLDYILDILITNKMLIKDYPLNTHNENNPIQLTPIKIRLEAVKPLVPMTIIDSIPFSTEQNRISLIVPVRSDSEVGDLISLINQYVNLCSEKQQQSHNYALIIALITHNSSPPSGYGRVMSMGLSLKTKYPNIKLLLSTIPREPNESYSTSTDLGLLMILRKRFTSTLTNSIVVILSSNTLITSDYLSRIQLNTIKDHQVYFPIAFQEYNLRPGSSGLSDSWRINKDNGLFNWFDYRHSSFYLDDFEKAFEAVFPPSSLSTVNQQLINYDILEVFLQSNCQSSKSIHILRSIEPELKLRYRQEKCDLDADKYTKNWCNKTLIYSLGNKAQMANLILNYKKSNAPIDWSP